MKKEYEVAIIGAGPAGISAALYLKQAGKDIIIIDGNTPGGTLNKIKNVKNYPGYIGEDGPTLAYNMFEQINKNDIYFVLETVKGVDFSNNNFIINTNIHNYYVKYLIIATGRNINNNGYAGVEKHVGNGVSYCALCDGNLYKNKDVMVLGKGNLDETVNYLSKICKKVYTANNMDYNYSNIENINDFNYKSIDKKDNKIIVNYNDTFIEIDGLFINVGNISPKEYIKNVDIEYKDNYIIVNDKMQTKNKNVYAAGDAIKKDLYQIVTAVSDGAIAAKEIINDINNK